MLKLIKGILCDIDGTLYFKGVPIPGAIETISELKKRKKILFLTNTDSKTPNSVYKKLLKLGFLIKREEIFTPIIAIKAFLRKNPEKRIFLVTTKEIETEFAEFKIVSKGEIPDFVIISDFSDNWDVNRLNNAFRFILKGAQLLGTQGNRYCLNEKGYPVIDTGSFVRMLAQAANVPYRIFGKPSKEFFNQAIERINLKPKECVVVGDDIESDIKGATDAGIKAILVKTGKASGYQKLENKKNKIITIDNFSKLKNLI